jgi:hypothetical protein
VIVEWLRDERSADWGAAWGTPGFVMNVVYVAGASEAFFDLAAKRCAALLDQDASSLSARGMAEALLVATANHRPTKLSQHARSLARARAAAAEFGWLVATEYTHDAALNWLQTHWLLDELGIGASPKTSPWLTPFTSDAPVPMPVPSVVARALDVAATRQAERVVHAGLAKLCRRIAEPPADHDPVLFLCHRALDAARRMDDVRAVETLERLWPRANHPVGDHLTRASQTAEDEDRVLDGLLSHWIGIAARHSFSRPRFGRDGMTLDHLTDGVPEPVLLRAIETAARNVVPTYQPAQQVAWAHAVVDFALEDAPNPTDRARLARTSLEACCAGVIAWFGQSLAGTHSVPTTKGNLQTRRATRSQAAVLARGTHGTNRALRKLLLLAEKLDAATKAACLSQLIGFGPSAAMEALAADSEFIELLDAAVANMSRARRIELFRQTHQADSPLIQACLWNIDLYDSREAWHLIQAGPLRDTERYRDWIREHLRFLGPDATAAWSWLTAPATDGL